MCFWWFMLLCDLLIPTVMMLAGYMMRKHCPKQINRVVGYRTARSMKNMDTWKFAHDYCGRLWQRIGAFLLPLSVLIHIPFYRSDVKTIGCSKEPFVTTEQEDNAERCSSGLCVESERSVRSRRSAAEGSFHSRHLHRGKCQYEEAGQDTEIFVSLCCFFACICVLRRDKIINSDCVTARKEPRRYKWWKGTYKWKRNDIRSCSAA